MPEARIVTALISRCCAAAVISLALAGQAFAKTFVVDSLNNRSLTGVADDDLTDGICDNGLGECTFDAAMAQARADDGRDTVDLTGISGRIERVNGLVIDHPVEIVGAGNVILDGLEVISLRVESPDVSIRGMQLKSFSQFDVFTTATGFVFDDNTVSNSIGLVVQAPAPVVSNSRFHSTTGTSALNLAGADGGEVTGNTFGLDGNGLLATGESSFGMNLQASEDLRIEDNRTAGYLSGMLLNQVSGATVAGNVLGNDETSTGQGSTLHGIFAVAVTGSVFEANETRGHQQQGILFTNASADNVVDAHVASSNGQAGVRLDGSTATIRHSNLSENAIGISATAAGSIFEGNRLIDNTGLGIDLGEAGVTLNSDVDAFTNFPLLTAAIGGASTVIEGELADAANTLFTLEFFASPACDDSGHGEGETPLGTSDVSVDGLGAADFAIEFPVAIQAGTLITATATGPAGTSEFSACVEAQPATPNTPQILRDGFEVSVNPQGPGSLGSPG